MKAETSENSLMSEFNMIIQNLDWCLHNKEPMANYYLNQIEFTLKRLILIKQRVNSIQINLVEQSKIILGNKFDKNAD